jgi:hypothetical protein
MMDDLRERIRRGDLSALADPALPLLLLADGPTAEWWEEGSERCARALWNALVRLGADGGDPAWSDDVSHLDRARRLRALLPSVLPEVDEALAVLERYAG